MTSYLIRTSYDLSSPLNRSDQILIPAALWTALDQEHGQSQGQGPMFVDVDSAGFVGRLRPAMPSDGLPDDCCRLPEWMNLRLGLVIDETWICLSPCQIPKAGHLILRAHHEASLLGLEDPAASLTAELSGSTGLSWACLSIGSVLPLSCGSFDVIDILSEEGQSVSAACILDCDVNLEFVPALDHVESESESKEEDVPSASQPMTAFVPFSGRGQRLGRS